METDPRHLRLRKIAARLGARAAETRALEAERNRILHELAKEWPGRGKFVWLAGLAGLTRGRVHQILKEGAG